MSDTIITLKNVTKIYEGKTILQNVNLSVPEGQSLTLCGHNGSGKSTLLKLMAGLVKPTSGSVTVTKKPLFHYIPEHFPKTDLTVWQYLKAMGRIDGIDQDGTDQAAGQLLKDFFMEQMKDVPMKHLSKGSLQKVGVIQALLKVPDIMLLDEPLSGQDRPSQMVFIEKMNHLREQKTTLIMSCHEPFLMHSLSDIIYQVQDGGLSLRENPGEFEESRYILVFEEKPDALLPSALGGKAGRQNGRLTLLVSGQESNDVIGQMLQSGFTLREMYEQ
ncbi:ATP-binding cassette domain-containing protein [Ruminococcus gauvreauii]|uniref:ABC transporter ATP-binding protein n=1 Tax=Ruminococcus gauvreauii TaxID=438033 RepID=A0ABY5VFS2_9FIRM|nr:ABC transporter ATP-binding protein [Ruminococcus gauvreauii]UWP59157.1 ABC transporter ATP-binding protein [Ruminococcus gauvreauii]